jgi:hypothetical protein
MPNSHQVLCLASQESCLTPQLLQQHLSKNDSCCTSWLNSGNSETLLTVLHSPNPTQKNAKAQWSEFSAIKSDDDDNDDNFLYDQSSVYHHNPADESDDSLSDSSYHNNYKHVNLTCHQISFAKKMNKWIPHLKGKVDLTKKLIPHLKGKVDLMKKPIPHLKGMVDLMKKLIPHLKVKMDLTLAPVDLMTPIQALSFLQMTNSI